MIEVLGIDHTITVAIQPQHLITQIWLLRFLWKSALRMGTINPLYDCIFN
jgi:hypothetical protein